MRQLAFLNINIWHLTVLDNASWGRLCTRANLA